METSEGTRERESAGSRVPLVAEVLGYVGAALVLTAGWAVMERIWPVWDPTVRMMAIGITATALLLAGVPFRKHVEQALSRMAGVLWMLSAALTMWFLGLFFADVLRMEFGQNTLAVGLAGGVYSTVLLALRPGALQQIPLCVGGLIATFGFAVAFGPTDHFCTGFQEPHWLTPSILVFGGLWFGAVAVGLLQPTATALVLGSATLFGAPLLAVGDLSGVAPLVGLVAAVVLLSASVVFRRVVLLSCGALGLFTYLNWSVSEYFGRSIGTPVALLIAGLGVLASALVAARRFGRRPDTARTPGTEGTST